MNITVTARDGARVFACAPGETILHAGLASGVDLPYECASGTCGRCKVLLVRGSVAEGWRGAPGRGAFRSAREVLTCQSSPLEDCVLEVAASTRAALDLPRPVATGGADREVRRLTEDVVAVEVELDAPLDFEAGQFALVGVPCIAGLRALSMASFEPAARRISFDVKRKPGGLLGAWMCDADVGARLSLFAPLGRSIFRPSLAKHLVCIAGGSGIAGIASILRRAEQAGYFTERNGDVFFGVRSARDVFLLDELHAVQSRFPARLRVTVALSDGTVPARLRREYPGLRFEDGLVHDVARRCMTGRFEGVRAYVAGPGPMVDASVRLLLREARLAPADICFDKF